MNILYHHRTQAAGAAGQHIREMVKAFIKCGHSVDIVSPTRIDNSIQTKSDTPKRNRYAVPQIMFELLEILYNIVDFLRIKNQLRKRKYNFIYERYAIFNIAGVFSAKFSNIPIIIESSFTSKTPVFPKRTKILSGLAYLCDRFIFSKADGVVVVSSVLKESLIKKFGVNAEKIVVLPNAVDIEEFNTGISSLPVKLKYNLNSNKVVGFIGGFYPWHGLDLFMDAAEDLLKVLPNVKFLLVGDGPMFNDLKGRVRNCSLRHAVIFAGPVVHSKLPEYISSFDVGVMPDSNNYGSPMKIFEYMAMGRPVLAPKLRPIEEVIENGTNGLLFEAKKRDDLAKEMLRLLIDKELSQKLALNAREKVLEKYTWVKNAQFILGKWQDIFKKKREVRFLSQYFHPEVASTAQLMTELASDMVEKGLSVKVFSGQPTYVRSERLARKESFNGIEIERLPCTRFEKNSFLGRLLNWSSYTFLVFFRLLFSRNRSPLFIVSTPPFLFVVGYLLNLIKSQKYICLVYDLYPEIAEKLGYIKQGTLIAKLWDRCNKKFFKKASFIVVPSENMKNLIEQKMGFGTNKVKVISNWADGEFIRPIDKSDNWFSRKYDLGDKLVVLYAGNMGLFHQLETIIKAAERLKENKDIKFIFIGEGGKKKKLMDMVQDKQLQNILFLPYQDRDVLPFSLACSDISVVSLEKNLDCVAAPCKLYTSLAAGQAILGLVDENSEVAGVVNKYQCGFCVAQDDVNGVVEILNNLSHDPQLIRKNKLNARRCFEQNFTKEQSLKKYYQLFSQIISQTCICPLCNSRDNDIRFKEKDYQLLACNSCGLLFIHPYPIEVNRIYKQVSNYSYEKIKILDTARHYNAEVEFYRRYFPLFERECKNASSILDVGCGTGHLLERLKAYPQLRRVGIELNSARAAKAKDRADCKILETPIEKMPKNGKFDVITMINVLSHIPSFDSLFVAIRSLLNKKGKLILKVDEMRNDVQKKDIFDWGIPDHLHFLGMDTLEFICRKYGFKICKHSRVPYSQELFSQERWKSPGRSKIRNFVKKIVLFIPFALPLLAKIYEMMNGRRLYSSFIVLTPLVKEKFFRNRETEIMKKSYELVSK